MSSNGFVLTAADCPTGQLGLFIMGPNQAALPFGNGVLCIGGGVLRLNPAQSTGAGGSASLQIDMTDPISPASQITPGSTWKVQFWYRDPAAGGAGFNLSDALSATFCP